MARFDVVVQEVGAQAEGESVDTASAGIPLATILERTRFEVSYASPAESREVTALDEKPQLP
ncbi:hypothetical protein ACFVTZ_11450 [Cellulosimicrobium cellulans]|uniref:hypothetical protein n=1 Tax=Cellulosimicrobium cellulans TaxID=1710 RepID=UPI0036E99884